MAYSLTIYDSTMGPDKREPGFEKVVLLFYSNEPGESKFENYIQDFIQMEHWCKANHIDVKIHDHNDSWILAYVFFCFKNETDVSAFMIRWK